MRTRLCLALVATLILAGCLGDDGPAPALPDPSTAAASVVDGPLVTRTSCVGYNAITFVDGAQMRPHVPANWTFTSPTGSSDLSILRIHAVACPDATGDDWRFHLVLSTPMHPDDASLHHHDNPDAVVGIYSNDPQMVANLSAAGAAAHNATFDWTESATGDTIIVTADAGPVLRLVTLDLHQQTTGSYAWPATYSAGTEDIHWFWGHENASTRPAGIIEATLGPGSPVPGITNTQWSVNAWLRFDLRYVEGIPEG